MKSNGIYTPEERDLILCPTRERGCKVGDCKTCGWNSSRENKGEIPLLYRCPNCGSLWDYQPDYRHCPLCNKYLDAYIKQGGEAAPQRDTAQETDIRNAEYQ